MRSSGRETPFMIMTGRSAASCERMQRRSKQSAVGAFWYRQHGGRLTHTWLAARIVVVLATACFHQSPTEALMAYIHETEGYWQVWVMEDDGTQARQVTYSGQDKRNPTWSPDGAKIAYRTNNGQLYLVTVASGEETEILRGIRNVQDPNWCGATNEIVFAKFGPHSVDTSDIWKADVSGTQTVLLTRDKVIKYQPVFSPAGDRVAFAKLEGKFEHHLWVMDADGTDLEQLTTGDGVNFLPAFSPDGESLAFASNRDGNFEVYCMDLRKREARRVTISEGLDTSPVFLLDGQGLAFVSNRSGSQQIWAMGIDGSNPRPLTEGPGESIDPACLYPLAPQEDR